MDQYRSGYKLAPFFYEQLSWYEKSKEPMSEHYRTLLKHLSVKDELARWEQTTKTRPK